MGFKTRARPIRTFKLTTEAAIIDDAPVAMIPIEVAEALGCREREIPVRAVINGFPFHAVLRAEERPFESHELGFFEPYMPLPLTGYTLYLYKQMRETVPIRHVGDRLDIELTYEEHPRNRRGMRVRAHPPMR